MHEVPSALAVSSPCSDCDAAPETVDRRTAIGAGVLSAVATILGTSLMGACATGHSGVSTTSSAGKTLGRWMLQVRPSDFPALAHEGGIARVDGESDKPVAIVRTADGYVAFSMRCTHAGGTLDLVDGGFSCPLHGAKFSAQGAWTGGRAAKNLRTLNVEYDSGKGLLTIVV